MADDLSGNLLMDAQTFINLPAAGMGRTRTIAFNASGASVQSWRADAPYRIRHVSGIGQAILNFSGTSYSILAAAGVHLDWIAIASTSVSISIAVDCSVDVSNGQFIYCSHGGSNSFLQVILEYVL